MYAGTPILSLAFSILPCVSSLFLFDFWDCESEPYMAALVHGHFA